MQPKDLPLLLASSQAQQGEEPYPLDRVRMQKAIFLATMRGSSTWSDMYSYRPYNWGPYSGRLVSDLGELVSSGTLTLESHPGGRYDRYEATAQGEQEAVQKWMLLDGSERAFIKQVRAFVTSRSFQRLLKDVYAAYPEYATKSQFTG